MNLNILLASYAVIYKYHTALAETEISTARLVPTHLREFKARMYMRLAEQHDRPKPPRSSEWAQKIPGNPDGPPSPQITPQKRNKKVARPLE